MTTPFVMISYSWDDAVAAELLHEELAMRGVAVVHDRCTFPTGSRISGAMLDAAVACDGYVVYFTESSLYENKDGPRPVIHDEFLPACDRLASDRPPVVMPLVHGLGAPRTEAMERVRRATGRDVSSLWMPVVLDQGTERITQPEAATVAHLMTSEVLRRASNQFDNQNGLDMSIVTRGSGQVPATVSVDATSILGGATARPGTPDDWERLAAGLRDLEGTLAGCMPDRRLKLLAKTHLTGAIGFGRTFHQAGGWNLIVAGRHGEASLDEATHDNGVDVKTDVGGRGDISVEIDLLGVELSALAAAALAAAPEPVVTRLIAVRGSKDDLQPREAAGAARMISDHVRDLVHDRKPSTVHLFCASPVEVAVLIGHRLTSLHTTIQLYERDGDGYLPSLRLSC